MTWARSNISVTERKNIFCWLTTIKMSKNLRRELDLNAIIQTKRRTRVVIEKNEVEQRPKRLRSQYDNTKHSTTTRDDTPSKQRSTNTKEPTETKKKATNKRTTRSKVTKNESLPKRSTRSSRKITHTSSSESEDNSGDDSDSEKENQPKRGTTQSTKKAETDTESDSSDNDDSENEYDKSSSSSEEEVEEEESEEESEEEEEEELYRPSKSKSKNIPSGQKRTAKKATTTKSPAKSKPVTAGNRTIHRVNQVMPVLPLRRVVQRDTSNLTPYALARERLHVSAVPDSLPCREEEFMTIMGYIESAIQEATGTCVYISGVPGTGKTATVLEVIRYLQHQAEQKEIPDFDFVEINGMKLTDPNQAYSILWECMNRENNDGKKKRYTSAHALELLEAKFSNYNDDQKTT